MGYILNATIEIRTADVAVSNHFNGDIMAELCEGCNERPGVYEIQGRLLCEECAELEAEDAGVVRK